MTNETVVTLKLTVEEAEDLRELAKSKGFIIGRGHAHDWGSIKQLLLAIRDKRLLLIPSCSVDGCFRAVAFETRSREPLCAVHFHLMTKGVNDVQPRIREL